ncbi:MAG: Ku protein, partial [bacterium]
MPRAIWTGAISFGLVNIPVELIPATRDTGTHFNQLHEADNGRVRYKKVCSIDDEELSADDIVKGVEAGNDEYVIVTDAELKALAAEKSDTIAIRDFVDLASIDPMYFDRPYYLVPRRNAAKPYHLLLEAMAAEKQVALATFVMRQKEYFVAIRPVGGALLLETMHFYEELVDIEELGGLGEKAPVAAKELTMARQLITSLSAKFEPENYKDEYAARVAELLEAKSKNEEVVTKAPAVKRAAKVVGLAAALE